MVAKGAKRPSPASRLDKKTRRRIVGQLGKKLTASQVAKANGVTVNQVRHLAAKTGVSTLRGSKTALVAPKRAEHATGGVKRPGARGRPKSGQVVAAASIRPAISKTCESCSFLMDIIRDLVGRLKPRGLLGAKR